ncbi:hypothetical protein BC833DRAFT_573181 [Globomyces pollinis-pini]|nr:hypothetical protein BC833DRAFT_573181 [Globomyces pollinis-pini]
MNRTEEFLIILQQKYSTQGIKQEILKKPRAIDEWLVKTTNIKNEIYDIRMYILSIWKPYLGLNVYSTLIPPKGIANVIVDCRTS